MRDRGRHAIFIGYRREDSQDTAGRIYDRLVAAFGESEVFKDVDNLPIGTDFGRYILTLLPQCRIFLALIGPGWLDARDESGGRRIDNPSDWVRIEIETALGYSGLQVVPVLVNGARMPQVDELPASMQALARLNAAVVRRDPDFHADMTRIVAAMKERVRPDAVVFGSRRPVRGKSIRILLVSVALLVGVTIGAVNILPRTTLLEFIGAGELSPYLRENPEVLAKAVQEVNKELELRKRIEGDPRDYSIGAADAPITIVEFFDYRCSFSRAARPWLQEVVRQNPRTVRLVFKEFPILGAESLEASKAAIAARNQQRYLDLHNALMTRGKDLDSREIDNLARSVGIDVARMRLEMENEGVREHLQANHAIAAEANVQGTPAILIDGHWLRGWEPQQAEQLLADAKRRLEAQ